MVFKIRKTAKKTESEYFITNNNKRLTGYMPDLKSARIVLKHFKKIPVKYLK